MVSNDEEWSYWRSEIEMSCKHMYDCECSSQRVSRCALRALVCSIVGVENTPLAAVTHSFHQRSVE